MKHKPIKQLLLMLVAFIPMEGIQAQSADYMNVYNTVGKCVSYKIDDIRKVVFPSIEEMNIVLKDGTETQSLAEVRKITFGDSQYKEVVEDEVLEKDETYTDVEVAPTPEEGEDNKEVILDVNTHIFQAENITININKDGKTPQISISVGGQVITKNIKVTRNIKGGIWTMLSLPFDIEISDILVEDAQVEIGSNLLIRIYDAAYRAANSVEGKTANGWKEKTSGTIPANQGFAVAINSRYDGDVQEVTFRGHDFAMDGTDKELTLNRHHSTANGGKDADWNFCGNPTLSNQEKENGHSLYIYNSENNTYDEYSSSQSATYLPFSAWFVQSANDFISMVFSTTSKAIKSASDNVEGTITLAINDGDDETSVILNSEASTTYQRNEDALYMESPNPSLSQLYIVEGNTQMAVSEQPAVEGAIKIGYKAAQAGEQTLTLTNLPDNTIAALEDNQTGEQTLMSVGDSYSFTTAAGTNNNRFNLRLTEITGIDQTGITTLKAVVVGDEIKLYGTEAGDEITLYATNGMIITQAVAEEGVTTIPTTATGVIIIKVGTQTIKVVK